jgi:hypothetical protein
MRLSAVLALGILAACRPGAGPLGRVARDTLPNGAVSVMSDGPTAWLDSTGWRLVEASRIVGGDSSAGELINPSDVVIDPAGRLYVADQSPTVIKVFGRDGRLIRTIGREGEGPGEMRSPILGMHAASLVVFDPRLARISVFDTSGRFIRSWPSICCHYSAITVDREGRIAVRTSLDDRPEFSSAFIRYSMDGAILDTVPVPSDGTPRFIELSSRNSRMRTSLPFAPWQVDQMAPDGTLIHGWTGDYQLVVSRAGRDTMQIFGRRWTPLPLSDARRQEAYSTLARELSKQWGEEAVSRAFSLRDIPKSAPAMQTFTVDPTGVRWISVPSADTTHALFDVFDSAGVYLGPVRAPWGKGYGVAYWGADEVVISGENAEGLPELVRYRIERRRRP